MQPAIEIRNLGKQYPLVISQPYIALRDVISNSAKNFLKPGKKAKEKFWALQDINLDIMPGERVGIIGRNGAGKSTLLKIISRITPPTTGHATIRGRVGSLLEVGTGFHPELTGRENIFLNGSILGLKKIEIEKQLDAIIDFSGVEKFIDTPLKHFSSGMQLRLAFAVAAHLEPEILLIDEVLAVGDAEFQKKCIGKMEDISKNSGRTLLFLSHNLGAVRSLCNKVVYLQNGRIKGFGAIDTIIEQYLGDISSTQNKKAAKGNGNVTIESCRLLSGENETSELFLGYPAAFELKFTSKQDLKNIEVAFNIRNIYGDIVTHSTTLDNKIQFEAITNETLTVKASLLSINITPGVYSIDIFVLNNGELCHGYTDFMEFSVINSDKALRPDGFPPHVITFSETNWEMIRHEDL